MIPFIVLFFLLRSAFAVFVPWLDNDPFTVNDVQTYKMGFGLPPVLPPDAITDETRSLPYEGYIPDYVIDSSPLVHLYSEELYYPADISDFIKHFNIRTNNNSILKEAPLGLHDLASMIPASAEKNDSVLSEDTFLTALDDFDKDPRWLLGHKPDYGSGHIKDAPAVLIVVDKGNGWVDAYWFYFYSFNLGAFIMGYGPWGNHVGDWEHSLVRFYEGKPQYLWMSAHGGGGCYQYDAIEKKTHVRYGDTEPTSKILERPLIFSARGTHANYASVGQHAHDVPFFFSALSDFTDRGPLWDPSLNYLAYTYNGTVATPATDRERALGSEWLDYLGHWGDKQLARKDPRQKWCPVQWRYIDGPRGPLSKNLDRTGLCQRSKWWNFWGGCPARRSIKRGQGLDAEHNDLVGDNCGILLYRIRPKWLRSLVRLVMWRGVTCFMMDYFTG
ncbi:LAME_0H19284g1_1 [Lachancea meyersii CBS 8951]|uniref:LAME_0H19284g1_1 n=1 Tax=Lachancea meyersii CBS 8951 TaxID=1266667 RepID=A0A1G4KJB3_9SACH|nr:LAME_0H19284g1_1 [Lachancea meyersii CBS 8951]